MSGNAGIDASAGGIAALKAEARRAVHDAFGTPATYEDAAHPVPVPLSVRWHGRRALLGAGEQPGYASTIETVERIVFDREELAAKSLLPQRGGVVRLTEFRRADGQPLAFFLDTREPYDGPVNLAWNVGRDVP